MSAVIHITNDRPGPRRVAVISSRSALAPLRKQSRRVPRNGFLAALGMTQGAFARAGTPRAVIARRPEADAAIRPRSPCQKLYISYWSFSKTQTKQQALPGHQYIWQKDKREFVEPPTGATTSSDLASLGHLPLKGKALGVPRCQKPSPSGEGGAKRRMRS